MYDSRNREVATMRNDKGARVNLAPAHNKVSWIRTNSSVERQLISTREFRHGGFERVL
jgi:hypothetical protein